MKTHGLKLEILPPRVRAVEMLPPREARDLPWRRTRNPYAI
jgi:hypothetical protein